MEPAKPALRKCAPGISQVIRGRLFFAALSAVLACVLSACGASNQEVSMFEFTPPANARSYVEDDDDRNRVTFAFADLRSELASTQSPANWDVKLYRIQTMAFTTLQQDVNAKMTAMGWQAVANLSVSTATGYQRAAWRKADAGFAIALVPAPFDAKLPQVLVVLETKR
jgi:hypothetical protein